MAGRRVTREFLHQSTKAAARLLLFSASMLAGSTTSALASHEVSFYPSYYPHEIRIDTLPPATAASRFADKTLHAYIGAAPGGAQSLPDYVKPVESLDSFVILKFNPASPHFATSEGRCATARGIFAVLRNASPDFVFHPYPVTPYHVDYLHHLDLIEKAGAVPDAFDPATKNLRVKAKGQHAEMVARARWENDSRDWDVSLEEVPARGLGTGSEFRFDGWLGPPWVKEGWFHAYRLLAPAISNTEIRQTADSIYSRLIQGVYLDLAERLDLERQLVTTLTRGCDSPVVGYTVRREYYNDDFSAGIENIAFDSQTGLNTPIFIRTAKLKDFPWNGELHLATDDAGEAAWNPISGFTDAAGRLIWSAVGEPALMPAPFGASWIPNRLDFDLERAQGQSGGFRVPSGSLQPQPGTGALRPVPNGAVASAKLVYEISASPYSDGSVSDFTDFLYTFALAYRWGEKETPDDRTYEPSIAAVLAAMRDRVAGIRTLRVKESINQIAPDVAVIKKTPVLEVYLRDTPGDPSQVAALGPPWSPVPWHLMVLMEEAVIRGHAAFSKGEADRRHVPWLDLVRDPALHDVMRRLIGEFEEVGYRPAALHDLVSEDEARARWRALRSFAEKNGHFLVTNGPYRLHEWKPGSVVLRAVREPSYPLGFGTFDRYVRPLRAIVRGVIRDEGQVVVRVDAEEIVHVQRHFETRIAPLSRSTARGVYGALVASRYLLVAPDGTVVGADRMRWEGDEHFVVDLPEDMPPGRYTILVAVYLDENSLKPSTGMLRFEVKG